MRENNNHRSQTVSALLVTHNDGNTLGRALDSLDWADEIIVVDQGSTDATLEIARKHTSHVFFHPSRDRAVLRQFALKKATKEWILHLEPDEWVEEMLRHKIDGVLLNPNGVAGFSMPIEFHWQDEHIAQGGLTRREVRLLHRKKARTLDDVFFSGFAVEGDITALDEAIGSEPFSDFKTLTGETNALSTRAAYRVVEAGGPYRFRKSAANLLIRPVYTFLYRYVVRLGFQNGMAGIILAYAASLQNFLKYAKFRNLLHQSAVKS